jgi:FKBP-type peptidyl-prolyl cis-trans isomerase FklB
MSRPAIPSLLAALAAALPLLFAAVPARAQSAPASDQERASYSLGHKIGSDFRAQGIEVETEMLLRGLRDALQDATPAMSEEEMREARENLRQSLSGRPQNKAMSAAERNLYEGRAFLAKNRQQPGVSTSISGLQYRIIAPGNGKKPGPQNRVTVHYRGQLLDGTEFDSSYRRGQPATFPVQGVIPGWTEALQMMRPGAKWQLFIPSDLAYRDKDMPGIGPNATLIFELELLSVQ